LKEITYQEITENSAIRAYIEKGNENLGILGFTEHSRAHAVKAAGKAAEILKELGYDERTVELAKIAGYMHDMGNCVNRHDHAHSGAVMAFTILTEMGMAPEEIAVVTAAIGHHDEGSGAPVDAVSAALILADKTDVRRNRVRNKKKESFDIHDRVNYAVIRSELKMDRKEKVILLDLELDDAISSILDYFEIFLERMLLCRRAAAMLGCRFKMAANGSKVV
jgi:metal-dependent HD superfamily phosphatase/phosphodiesterase